MFEKILRPSYKHLLEKLSRNHYRDSHEISLKKMISPPKNKINQGQTLNNQRTLKNFPLMKGTNLHRRSEQSSLDSVN